MITGKQKAIRKQASAQELNTQKLGTTFQNITKGKVNDKEISHQRV